MELFTRLFPLWAIALSAVAYFIPAPFAELKYGILPLLTVIMFSMGLTLTIDDIKRVLSMPKLIISGLFTGYSCAKLLGYETRECRTLAIEVGMQNSGLAVALAIKHFSYKKCLTITFTLHKLVNVYLYK